MVVMQLQNLREGKSTGRASVASHGRRSSSRHPSVAADPAMAALIEKIRLKIYQKYKKLRDAFRNFDQDKSGLISVQELYTALRQLGAASDADLSGGRLQALCQLCGQGSGEIDYNRFADQLKVIDTGVPLIGGEQRDFASGHA